MRTYTTAQVVRLLDLHHEDKFSAPWKRSGMKTMNECRASRDGADNKFARFEEKRGGRWVPVMISCIDLRSDWTRVKPAKAKRERVKVGDVRVSGGNVSLDNHKSFCELGDGAWTLYAVKDTK